MRLLCMWIYQTKYTNYRKTTCFQPVLLPARRVPLCLIQKHTAPIGITSPKSWASLLRRKGPQPACLVCDVNGSRGWFCCYVKPCWMPKVTPIESGMGLWTKHRYLMSWAGEWAGKFARHPDQTTTKTKWQWKPCRWTIHRWKHLWIQKLNK